jgi:hypothetical protein
MGRLQYLNELSPSTRETYSFALRAYFKHIYGEGELEDLVQKYFDDQRDFGEDISSFLASLNGRPPKTINLYLST